MWEEAIRELGNNRNNPIIRKRTTAIGKLLMVFARPIMYLIIFYAMYQENWMLFVFGLALVLFAVLNSIDDNLTEQLVYLNNKET